MSIDYRAPIGTYVGSYVCIETREIIEGFNVENYMPCTYYMRCCYVQRVVCSEATDSPALNILILFKAS